MSTIEQTRQVQLWLPVPVVPAPEYILVESRGKASIVHKFRSLTDATTYVVIYGWVNVSDAELMERTLLSGQEWRTRRRRWRLSTGTKRTD